MHTYIFVGVLISVSAASIGLAAFFIRAWTRRRSDSEYFLFGLLTLCLAVHTALMALGYYRAANPAANLSVRFLVDGLALTSKVALPLLLHFALRYARVEREWRFTTPAYGLTALFAIMILAGIWWAEVPSTFATYRFWGVELPQLRVRVIPAAYLFYVMVVVVIVTVVSLLGREVLRGRREGLMAFIGSIVLAATMINDAALGTGLFPTVPLIFAGYLALALGTGFTLVARYGTLSIKLAERSEQLRTSLDELRISYEQLERTQQELVKSEQLAVVGELAAVIAHEVRNPLAAVSNAVVTLRKGETAAGDRTLLFEIIEEEVARLDKLVGQLLNYARPVVADREQVDLEELIQRSMSLAGEHQNLQCEIEVDGNTRMLIGDPNLLRQAFDNIIANAAQAMENEGTLHVQMRPQEVDGVPSVAIAFADQGHGMSEQLCSQARSPFFTTRSTGTGLGLAIVDRIVDAHGGRLDIDSETNVGTTVTVTFPLRRDGLPGQILRVQDGRRVDAA